MSATVPPLDRLCVHTITTKPLALPDAVEAYARAGITGITVWEDALSGGAGKARQLIERSGLTAVSLCRGGFFVSPEAERRNEAIEDNRRLVRDAAELGAPLVVLVCGAHPDVSLVDARDQIRSGIEAILPTAERCGVQIAIEPLHPMYADTRSAVNTMASANDLAEAIDHDHVGIAVDVYHTWWDPDLEREIARCGTKILAFHVCDWRSPTRDLLNDRGLMGDGCIPIKQIRGWVEDAGFDGFIEVEVFSNEYWSQDQVAYVGRIVRAYQEHV